MSDLHTKAIVIDGLIVSNFGPDIFPNLTATMERRQWSAAKIDKVIGGNWLQLLKGV